MSFFLSCALIDEEMVETGREKERNRDLSLKKIFLFAWPIMVANILQITFNFADTLVVGNYVSKEGLAAVGTTAPITIFFIWGLNGLSLGANVLISRMIGAKEDEKIRNAIFSALMIGLVFGTGVALFGFTMSEWMLKLLATPEDILMQAVSYMRTYFIAAIAIGIFDFGAAVLRSDGNSKDPTLYLGISGVGNVLLNFLFIVVFHLGVIGAAWASVISQSVAAALILIRLMRNKGIVSLVLDMRLLDLELVKKMLQYGIPSAIQNQLFSFSNMMIQSSINSFGSAFIAANTAANAIEEYVYVFVDAFPLTALTFVSRTYGAKRFREIFKLTLEIFIICGIGAFSIGLIIFLNGHGFLRMLNSDPMIIELGLYRLRYVTLFLFLNGLLDVIVNSIRGMGITTLPTIVTLFAVCGFRLLYIYLYFSRHHTPEVLYLCFPLSWILALFLQLPIFFYRYKQLLDLSENVQD